MICPSMKKRRKVNVSCLQIVSPFVIYPSARCDICQIGRHVLMVWTYSINLHIFIFCNFDHVQKEFKCQQLLWKVMWP